MKGGRARSRENTAFLKPANTTSPLPAGLTLWDMDTADPSPKKMLTTKRIFARRSPASTYPPHPPGSKLYVVPSITAYSPPHLQRGILHPQPNPLSQAHIKREGPSPLPSPPALHKPNCFPSTPTSSANNLTEVTHAARYCPISDTPCLLVLCTATKRKMLLVHENRPCIVTHPPTHPL